MRNQTALPSRVVVLLALLAMLGGLATARPGAAQPAESSTTYPQLVAVVEQWRQRGARVEVAGQSLQGRDLYRVQVGTGPVTVLLTGALHANEPSGTEAIVRALDVLLGSDRTTFAAPHLPGVRREAALFRALADPKTRRELLTRVTVVAFPMMDPDGVQAGRVRNQLLNMDYASRLTAQTAALSKAVEQFRPDVYVDLHGGPNAPELNLGYIKPDGVEPAIAAAGVSAARTMWRAADRLGVRLAYFEEQPASLLLGQHTEPFRSADRAYYDVLTSALPLTQQGFALEGVPSVYTETVGLQSTAPVITISQGASAQQAGVLGLVLELSGLLTGERPHRIVASATEPLTLRLPAGARDVQIVLTWGAGVYGRPGAATQDYQLQARVNGRTVTSGGGSPSATRRSRAVSFSGAAGMLEVRTSPRLTPVEDAAVVRVSWRVPEPRKPLAGILGDPGRVAYCLADSSTWDKALPQYSGPAC